ncbi:MAG: matrixin family metalloprotease [Candidatus Gastranaerophilales bacterium]|nr:matrixin family metalloprotease [Candidatus Gastranaerophilales bacterium]
MQTQTYLHDCITKGKLSRWHEKVMPLSVYIGKFNWYKSKGVSDEIKYTKMITDAFNIWERLSGGIVSFKRAANIYDSNINVEWKRVERKSLGSCTFNYDKLGRYYSAEVSIGLSDGIIHHKYMDENEVFHTILHEIGHSVGLGHSKTRGDIMYVPHEYGVVNVSHNDIATLRWLYKMPVGKSEKEILAMYPQQKAKNLDDLVKILSGEKSDFEKTKDALIAQQSQKDLLQENENIGDLKKYQLQLNNLDIKIDKSKFRN